MPDTDQPLRQTGSSTPAPVIPRESGPVRKILITVLILALGGIGYFLVRGHWTSADASHGEKGARALPIPVVVGTVAQKDVPIYLDGLGTVQAYNTVTVRSRVDGQLVQVAFTEGQEVKAGDILAQIDPAPYQAALDQAVAKKEQDAAQLANARVDLQRYADMLKTDSVTKQIYDTQKALLAQLEASVKADQAAVDSARVQFDYTTIRSPINGRVGIRQVDQGNIVHASDTGGLVVVTQLRPISVLFTLPEQVLLKLQEQGNDFTVLAVARDNASVLAEGKLAVVDNQIDSTTGTIKLKATFPNENQHLWPGQFVNTRLHLTTRTKGVVVPASVVQRGPEGAFAFVIQEDQTVVMRALQVAQIERGEALIDAGLTSGERVVVDGQYKLQPGAQVRPAEAAQGNDVANPRKPAGSGKIP